MEVFQIIVSNHTEVISLGSAWQLEKKIYRYIKEAFDQRTSAVKRELVGFAIIQTFVRNCALAMRRSQNNVVCSTPPRGAEGDSQRTETDT